MATWRFTVEEALDAVFDDNFSLSDGESSEEEEGGDLYALLGEPVIRRSDIDALTRDLVVSDDDGNDDGNSDGDGDIDGNNDSDSVGDRASDGPGQVAKKLECVVCNTRRAKLKLTQSQVHHETRFKCTHCNFHLCIDVNWQCFVKYHTLVHYWS